MAFLIAFAATLLSFLVIDAVWISIVVRKLYEREVGELLREFPRLAPAVVFYVGYAAGIVLLAVRPGVAQGSIGVTLAYGAVLGALAYGSFTITNYSVLTHWTMTLVITDIAWGAVLTAAAAACGHYAIRLFN
ncbi:MAG: DUF2177 family protein [Acidiferrobacterales bacterium]|nr:DUF2177 family protein [Acidiferrobacterales bacterium]